MNQVTAGVVADEKVVLDRVYKAKFEYQTEEDVQNNTADSITIQFRASSDRGALQDAIRWFCYRRKNFSEHFNRLCAVAISGQTFGHINTLGQLRNCDNIPYIVWKIDANPIPDDVSLSDIGWQVESMTFMMRKAQGI